MATKKRTAAAAADRTMAAARRQRRALAAGAWRLAELTSLEERVSVYLAVVTQLCADGAPTKQRNEVQNLLWDLLLAERSAASRLVQLDVRGSVREAADPKRVRKALATIGEAAL